MFAGGANDLDVQETLNLAGNSDLEAVELPVIFVGRGGYRALEAEVSGRPSDRVITGVLIANQRSSIIIIYGNGDSVFIDTHRY